MDNLWNYLPNLKKKLYVILYYKDRNHTTSATLHVCKHDAYVEVNLPWCYHCYLVDKYWQMSLCRQRAHYDLCFVGGSLDLASKLSHPSQMHKNHAWNISIVSDGYLAHIIEQPNLRIPNPQYLQQNFVYLIFCLIKCRTNSQQRHL